MKIINKTLAFLIGCVSLFSCMKEDPTLNDDITKGFGSVASEKIDGGTISYQFRDETKVLSKSDLNYLQEIIDDTTLIFSEDMPSELVPQPGDILSSRITDKTPYGLGNKVISVKKVGNAYVVETEPATLEEIFQDLEVDYTCNMADIAADGFYDKAGNYYKFNESAQTKGFDNKRLEFNFPELTWKAIFVEGRLYLDPSFHFNISLRKHTHEIAFECYTGIDVACGVKESIKKTFHIIEDATVLNGVLPVGPLVLRPYLDFSVDFVPELEGSVSTSISKEFGFYAGHVVDDSHDGFVFEGRSSDFDGNIIKNLEIDGTGTASLVMAFKTGTGLYTKRIAAELKPNIYIEAEAECSLKNSNLFRGLPEMNNDITLALKAGFSGYLVFDFGKLYDYEYDDTNIIDVTLCEKKFSLFPVIDKESLQVTKKETRTGLVFEGSYTLSDPGLLSRFIPIRPTARIYRGSDLIYSLDSTQKIEMDGDNKFTFTISGVEEDVVYVFNPCMTVFGAKAYEADGFPFSSTSPTAAITDIVQTDEEYSQWGFNYRGYNYPYRFSFYIKQHLIGAENCSEWGIYSPTSTNIYNPTELKDGPVIEYWTGYSSSPDVTFSYTPYVKLLDGSLKLFETKEHTLRYKDAPLTKSIDIYNTSVTLQLDSVTVNGVRVR